MNLDEMLAKAREVLDAGEEDYAFFYTVSTKLEPLLIEQGDTYGDIRVARAERLQPMRASGWDTGHPPGTLLFTTDYWLTRLPVEHWIPSLRDEMRAKEAKT